MNGLVRHAWFQAAKKLLRKEFALLMVLDWIKKGDARVIDRYLETSMGDVDINMHSGKVRQREPVCMSTHLHALYHFVEILC
jgi:hypothetical protein